MKKGFTLIELLAVIVILAIIALIATPIILGIINDARKESNERSAELYASAVKNAIASYQLTHPNAPTTFEDLDVQYDGNVVCAKEELYADGSFYIADCIVNGNEVDYTYGTKQDDISNDVETSYVQVYKPQYYSWTSEMEIGENLPSDAKTTASELNQNYSIYLGLDVDDNNKVIAAYACFLKNEKEYCLKGADEGPGVINANLNIIRDAYSNLIDTKACEFLPGDNDLSCEDDNLLAHVGGGGYAATSDDNGYCGVYSYGGFECYQ